MSPAILLLAFAGLGGAAETAIGIAMASGPFKINHSEVKGNASLFEGSEVTTAAASSKLRISGGARLELGTYSQAKVYAGRTILEKGSGQIEGAPGYGIEARTLRIAAADPKSIARVQFESDRAIRVSAVNGPVRITTASGLLVARVSTGNNLRLEPQTESSGFDVTGCVLKKRGQFILVDQTTNQVFEIRGLDLNSALGNREEVKGVSVADGKPVDGATQVIQGSSHSLVAPGGCIAVATSVGADPLPGATLSPAAPAAAKAGPNKAVILGVIVGGGAAAGAALALGSSKSSKSP